MCAKQIDKSISKQICVQILVVVANIPRRPWKAEVEKGFV